MINIEGGANVPNLENVDQIAGAKEMYVDGLK